jgi:beta-1,4-mannosyltransferase
MSAIPSLPNAASAALERVSRPLRVLAWPIDRRNPYTTSLYARMDVRVRVERYSPGRILHRYDVWHVHWPESLLNIRNAALAAFKVRSFLAMIDLVRLRGGSVVWTVHNLKAHEALHPVLEANFWRRFVPRVDGVIALSETGLALAQERFPCLRELPAEVIPHGHYRDQYPRCEVNARAELGISSSARVILFFGAVREYKNVEGLVRAFREVKTPHALLVVAGAPNKAALTESIGKCAAGDSRVRLDLRFIESGQVTKYFAAADLVVLPYSRILNSGSALLALSFDRPVLVPELGSMLDLQREFGSEWVSVFSSDLDSAELERGLDWAAQPGRSICSFPEKYGWRNIRNETVRFYEKVIAR